MGNLLWRTFVRGVHKAFGYDSPYAQKEYGKNWTTQRQRCLDRDDHECRVCGADESAIGREPAVHHITPRNQFDDSEWRQYNDLSNLVTLCPTHHGQLEGEFTDASPREFENQAKQYCE